MPDLTTEESNVLASAAAPLRNPGVFSFGADTDGGIVLIGGHADRYFGVGGKFVRALFLLGEDPTPPPPPATLTLTLERISLPPASVAQIIYTTTFAVGGAGQVEALNPEPGEPASVWLPGDRIRWRFAFSLPGPVTVAMTLRPYYQLNGV